MGGRRGVRDTLVSETCRLCVFLVLSYSNLGHLSTLVVPLFVAPQLDMCLYQHCHAPDAKDNQRRLGAAVTEDFEKEWIQ